MITYRKSLLNIGETWFDEETKLTPVDVLCSRFSQCPVENGVNIEFYTMMIDLHLDKDRLFLNMKKNTRYEIRRAATTDDLVYEYWSDNCHELLPEFCEFYDKFAAMKKLLPANHKRLDLLAKNNVLDISRISKNGAALVWHAFFRGKEQVQLIYSPSTFRASTDSSYRNFVGRANRYHHWLDILRYKDSGLSHYGFGVWYTGNEDKTKLSVNHFKSEFGGEIIKRFECKRGLTMKGRLASKFTGVLLALRNDKFLSKLLCVTAVVPGFVAHHLCT